MSKSAVLPSLHPNAPRLLAKRLATLPPFVRMTLPEGCQKSIRRLMRGGRAIQHVYLEAIAHDDVAAAHAGLARPRPCHGHRHFGFIAALGHQNDIDFRIEVARYRGMRRSHLARHELAGRGTGPRSVHIVGDAARLAFLVPQLRAECIHLRFGCRVDAGLGGNAFSHHHHRTLPKTEPLMWYRRIGKSRSRGEDGNPG